VSTAIKVFPDTYVDSVVQLQAKRAQRADAGVEWTSAATATPANVDTLRSEGVSAEGVEGIGPNDLFVVARAADDEIASRALEAGQAALRSQAPEEQGPATTVPRSLRDALRVQHDANVAVISVPGDYATLAAYQALSCDLHVLLFSDNVPLEKEIALKDHALARNRLVMGPGAGTAVLAGTGLGFANAVRPGPVGIVAAAGTGAQEAMTLLHRWGAGVSQVIGVGGRDLSAEVGGRMAKAAIAALREDGETEAILLVSKPPDPGVAADVVRAAAGTPMIAALIGLGAEFPAPEGVRVEGTLGTGVRAPPDALGLTAPDTAESIGPTLVEARARLASGRRLIRGLFSGGTLCYESLVILGRTIGEVRSNTPIRPDWGLPAPPGSHQCLDLGEEEFTRGRPHPMIDPEARMELIREHAADPEVAVILLDVVLGYGAHQDPAGLLAPVCAEVMADGGPQVVAYVLGTDEDPQGFSDQRGRLVEAGCIVTETAARATLVAAALATDEPALVGTGP
jgi:FdrA protein